MSDLDYDDRHMIHDEDCPRSETRDWCTCNTLVEPEDCPECNPGGGPVTTIDSIITEVEDWYGLPHGAIRTQIRERHYVKARHIAMYVASHMTGLSYPKLAKAFGRRDHTTVMHGVRRVADDPELRFIAEEVIVQLGGAPA